MSIFKPEKRTLAVELNSTAVNVYWRLSDMKVGKFYKIDHAEKAVGKYSPYPKRILFLSSAGKIYLPERYKLTDKQLEKINYDKKIGVYNWGPQGQGFNLKFGYEGEEAPATQHDEVTSIVETTVGKKKAHWPHDTQPPCTQYFVDDEDDDEADK